MARPACPLWPRWPEWPERAISTTGSSGYRAPCGETLSSRPVSTSLPSGHCCRAWSSLDKLCWCVVRIFRSHPLITSHHTLRFPPSTHFLFFFSLVNGRVDHSIQWTPVLSRILSRTYIGLHKIIVFRIQRFRLRLCFYYIPLLSKICRKDYCLSFPE